MQCVASWQNNDENFMIGKIFRAPHRSIHLFSVPIHRHKRLHRHYHHQQHYFPFDKKRRKKPNNSKYLTNFSEDFSYLHSNQNHSYNIHQKHFLRNTQHRVGKNPHLRASSHYKLQSSLRKRLQLHDDKLHKTHPQPLQLHQNPFKNFQNVHQKNVRNEAKTSFHKRTLHTSLQQFPLPFYYRCFVSLLSDS